MAHEDALWNVVREQIGMYGDLRRVENRIERGTPDVDYCIRGATGNIELKSITKWPTRKDTLVTLECYTDEQRRWHECRNTCGGRVFVLLRVLQPYSEYLLLWATDLAQVYGTSGTREVLRGLAVARNAERGFPQRAILRALVGGKDDTHFPSDNRPGILLSHPSTGVFL